MAKAQTFDLACNTCEEIGPCLIVGRAVRGRPHSGRPRAGAAAGLAAWAQFTKSHGGHDIRLLAEGYDHVIPLEGWMPRPEHGPAASGGRRQDQLVACPDCRAVYLHGDRTRRAVVFSTADQGTKWFLFCRNCRNVWGEAATDRLVRAELTRSDPDLWALQRQGIHEQAAER